MAAVPGLVHIMLVIAVVAINLAVAGPVAFASSGRTAQWQRPVPESWKEPPWAGRKRQL